MKIGETIKEIREKQKGLRQEDIAKALGLSTKAYSNIENNISDITLTRLQEISEVLGVSPEYILNYQDKSTYTNIFNNYEGNNGTINMFQGNSSEHIKNLENQINKSKKESQRLKERIQASNN